MSTAKQPRAAVGADKNNTKSVTDRAKGVSSSFVTKSSIFVNPNPTPATIDAQIASVDKAETLAGTRVRGGATARNVARTALWRLLQLGRQYVQGLADSAPTPEDAKALIEASGYQVAQSPVRQKALLQAKKGAAQNSAALIANLKMLLGSDLRKKHCLNWQYTVDGGKTFVDLPSTPKGKTTILNLTPLTTYGFRVAYTNSDGILQAWSPVVTYIVH